MKRKLTLLSTALIISLGLSAQSTLSYSYSSSSYELFSVEYYGGNVYSLARPIGGGDMKLLETNLTSGTETVIDTRII
jgi:hypothetical protein